MSEVELPVVHVNWGQRGYLTAKQQRALEELRARCAAASSAPVGNGAETKKTVAIFSPEENDVARDERMLRFLRDRRFDVDKAFSRIVEDSAWRARFKDAVPNLDKFPELLEWHMKGGFYLAGTDLEGRPLMVMKLAQIFPHKVSSVEQIVAFIKYYVDELIADCQRRGVVNEISAIGDMSGWSIRSNFSLSLVASLTEVSHLHFPETTGRVLLVNLGNTFNTALRMVKPFVDERQMARVVSAWDEEEMMEKFPKFVSPDVLEVEYGGTHAPYPRPDPIFAKLIAEAERRRNGKSGMRADMGEEELVPTSMWGSLVRVTRAIWSVARGTVMVLVGGLLLFFFAVTLQTVLISNAHANLRALLGGVCSSAAGLFIWVGVTDLKRSIRENEALISPTRHRERLREERRRKRPLEVSIPETRIVGNDHVEYQISTSNGDETVHVWRRGCSSDAAQRIYYNRYNEFREMVTKSKFANMIQVTLPPKTWSRSFDVNWIEERRRELEMYCKELWREYLRFLKANRTKNRDRVIEDFFRIDSSTFLPRSF